MKRSFLQIVLLFIFVLTLVGCVGHTTTTTPPAPGPITPTPSPENPENPNQPTDPNGAEEIEFSVCLTNVAGDILHFPITVTWFSYNGDDQKSAVIGEDGYARTTGLDGEYGIHLSATPEGTTYDPNAYIATNEKPHVAIVLELYETISRTAGTGLYGSQICALKVNTPYRISLKENNIDLNNYAYSDKHQGVKYFKFNFDVSDKGGTYVIESRVDLYEDTINPYVIDFGPSNENFINKDAAKIRNGGGNSKNGYTQNFRFYITYSTLVAYRGNCYVFGIAAESKTKEYPMEFDFIVKYYSDDEGNVEHNDSEMMYVTEQTKETFAKLPDKKTPKITGGTFVPTMAVNGVIRSNNIYYNETDGFYHVGSVDSPSILCAYITKANPYIDKPLNHLEDEGPALTVSDGAEYYREYFYLENDPRGIQYYTNEDGLCYVNKELKEVLQKISVAQRYFMDGNGYIEYYHQVYASEEDQWLYDCCYYTF